MMPKRWREKYAAKLTSAEEALSNIRNGQTIYIGSGAGEPSFLTDVLAEMAPKFQDLLLIHLLSLGKSKFITPSLSGSIRYNTFYVGAGVAQAVAEGAADFIPMNIGELPRAFAERMIKVDVALIQVSPPDLYGQCSLGTSVDAAKAAVKSADIVIAQVNENMPFTMGDSMIPVGEITYLVEGNTQLLEAPQLDLDPVALTIGRHISKLIKDGMTIHFGRDSISAAAMRYLDTKNDLGIHTEILTDDIHRLIEIGVVTNLRKRINAGKTVATMVLGSRELYRLIDRNPNIEIRTIDYVSDPFVISQNDDTVSILTVDEIELSGMAKTDTELSAQGFSLPSSSDFIDGANRSKNGFSIIALPSTTPDGSRSRIVVESLRRGVAYNRAKVHYVVTEYGVVNLYGLSTRERALALISISHPKFRAQLVDEAKRLNYISKSISFPSDAGSKYPDQYEIYHTLKNGKKVLFRPIKPTDARLLQKMFYSLSPETVRQRYHGTIDKLSSDVAYKMAIIDYRRDVAIVGVVQEGGEEKIIAEGRYNYNPTNNMAEYDMVVLDEYKGLGIGNFLSNYLKKIAYTSGLSGVYAEVIQLNAATIRLLRKAWPTAKQEFDAGVCLFTVRFPPEDVERPKDSIIIYSGRFNDFFYRADHPFRPDRARVTLNLIFQQGYLKEPWMRVEEPRPMPKTRLIESHSPDYILALEKANSGAWDEEFLKYNLGGDDCPVFPRLFDFVLLYASATNTAVDMIIHENANIVFNLLGGFHHASRTHAEGFCYVNDAILAIDRFLAYGYKVAYIDIDAHHGNGVQDAYYRDDRVLVCSIHESGSTLYPWSGFEMEIGEDLGRGFTVNVPLPQGADDEAFEWAFDRIIAPAVKAFAPSVVVAVVGADSHKNDPLSHLSLTNNGMANVASRLKEFSNHILLLSGGGYDIPTTSRAWCRVWAAVNRIDDLPDYLLGMGGMSLRDEGLGTEIIDSPYRLSGGKKAEIMRELERIAAFHNERTIPVIKQRTEMR
ncbi:MAG: hypothetical protein Kow0090_10020 [Myxococcota bacterium]